MPPRHLTWNPDGSATFAGAPVAGLASAFGTPLYLFDEADLRERLAAYADAFGARNVAYAAKAFLTGKVLQLAADAGSMVDVVSEGELEFCLRSGFPGERIVMHGLHKPPSALRTALGAGVGRIVLESEGEIAELAKVARAERREAQVLLRLAPAVDAKTHPSLSTGSPASQFGVPVADGQARAAVEAIRAERGALNLLGYHVHIGSQIEELDAFAQGAAVVLGFARHVEAETGFRPAELDFGGGLGIGPHAPSPAVLHEALSDAVAQGLPGGPPPRLLAEPGRYIAGPPGVTVYRIVQRKRAADGRTYLIVDGGMSDGPRPALYGARPDVAVTPRRAGAERLDIAGMHCESGDIVRRDVEVSPAQVGDLLIVLDTGAYNHSMASHYNRVAIPPVVFVEEGVARPATRRDNLADWLRLEVRQG